MSDLDTKPIFFAVTWKKSFELFQYQNSLHAYMYMDDKFHENNTKYLYNEFEAWFFGWHKKSSIIYQ